MGSHCINGGPMWLYWQSETKAAGWCEKLQGHTWCPWPLGNWRGVREKIHWERGPSHGSLRFHEYRLARRDLWEIRVVSAPVWWNTVFKAIIRMSELKGRGLSRNAITQTLLWVSFSPNAWFSLSYCYMHWTLHQNYLLFWGSVLSQ